MFGTDVGSQVGEKGRQYKVAVQNLIPEVLPGTKKPKLCCLVLSIPLSAYARATTPSPVPATPSPVLPTRLAGTDGAYAARCLEVVE
eukprot:2076034-Rhodomonas_salina.6